MPLHWLHFLISVIFIAVLLVVAHIIARPADRR